MIQHSIRRILPACLAALLAAAARGEQPGRAFVKLHEVPFTKVRITDAFWAPRRETNRKVSIPHSLDMLVKTGTVANFDLAAKGLHSGFQGPVFVDSDLYKAIEAASYSLATDPDPGLENRLDEFIAKIAAAQAPDGYLNTYYLVNEPDRRYTNLRDNHELYCAGHLFEAAVAHYQATGKRTLLTVAQKYADYMCKVFGPGPGQRMGYPGHPEAELALVKLWKATGEKRYFDLARFFVENRGSHFFATEHHTPLDQYDGSYWQDNVPIRDHKRIVGHAVRAAYLFAGVTDVMAETGDEGLRKMIDRVWRNTSERNTYLTGGIGPSAHNEGFTEDYDLPNLTAYQETCASVAIALWAHRLNLLYGDARYADAVETALYNGILSGVSLDGKRFFYVNPLESRGDHHRSEWFGCACCPPNVARTLAALGNYAYAVSDDGLWVNLYVQGGATMEVAGQTVNLDVQTNYPWEGEVRITPRVATPTRFKLRLRVPGWCRGAWVEVDGNKAPVNELERGYIVLDRTWTDKRTVDLHLPMTVDKISAHPRVREDAGCLALRRGPIVYCMEAVDNAAPLHTVAIAPDTEFKAVFAPTLLGGVVTLEGAGLVADPEGWEGKLYRADVQPVRVALKAVPYYAWDNRAPGEMRVWFPTTPPPPPVGGPEMHAAVTLSFVSGNCQPSGIHDGVEPKRSNDRAAALCHFWPHKGTQEWAQYTWDKPVTLTGSRVYWFDDTGIGECRPPKSWRLEYLDGNEWKPVKGVADYPVAKDRWCAVQFDPIRTTSLRLVVQLQPDWAVGIHEWQVTPADEDD
jgi:hypothetical protein